MRDMLRMGLLAVALAQTCGAANPGEKEMPAGITISLEAERTNYFLGENILLHYRIENAGSNAFPISVGGDYRGSSRAARFQVTALSADGQRVPDPTPVVQNFGGLSPDAKLKAGGVWFELVWVIKYCRFEQPGTYTVRAFHDLGFGEKRDADPREVSLTLTLEAPTEAQARALLVADENAKPDPGTTWGQKGEARLDYACIRYPAWVPALRERAQAGNTKALEGIASIRTLAATEVLIELLNHSNQTFAARAGQLLEARLPHPELDRPQPTAPIQRPNYIEDVWDEKLARAARDFSLRLLASTNRADLLIATSLLKRIGTASEVPALRKALEIAVTQTHADYLADIHYPAPIRVCDSLLGTALALDPTLDIAPADIRSPGQALLFIARHGGSDHTFSPAEEAAFVKLLRHSLAYVRMKALESLPRQIPAPLAESVTQCMTDPNVGVQNYAFLAAERMQDPRHRDLALSVLKSTPDHDWLAAAASGLAVKYGARYECAQAWAGRIVVPKDINDYQTHRALQHLFELTTGRGPNGGFTPPLSPASARALRERWKKFLTDNQEKIQSGDKFQLGDAKMPADLLPGGWNF